MKLKKSKFIKFFIVCLVSIFGFFGVNIITNADSVWNIGDDISNYMLKSHFNWDIVFIQNSAVDIQAIASGNDTLVWFDNPSVSVGGDDWVFYNSEVNNGVTFQVPRAISLVIDNSNENLLCYSCGISNLSYTDYLIFEKNNFFMRLNDLNSLRLPSILLLQTNAVVTMEINGFIIDKKGNSHELSIVTDTRNLLQDTIMSLYPTNTELFGTIDLTNLYNSNAIMYISNYRCRIDFPLNHTMRYAHYYYSVQSVEDYNIRYGTILSDYVGLVSSNNMVEGVSNGINSFLQIEILPGLSFFGILLLAVAVPLLIWILKIFFGG